MTRLFFSAAAFFLLAVGLFAADLPARATAVEGPVIFERGAGAEWEEVTLYHPVRALERYVLQEGGRLEIELNDGSYARIGPGSDILIEEVGLDSSRLTLYQGALIVRTEADSFVTVTAGMVRASAQGVGLFRIESTPEGKVSVSSRFGEVELTDGIRTRTVSRGQHLELSSSGLLASSLGFGFALDGLDQWSDERDARLLASHDENVYAGGAAPDHLWDSSGLAYGSPGAWGGYSGYGQHWMPYMGWGSFYRTNFRFYPGFGFGHCAFEPWGFYPAFAWSPFHSWAYVRPLSRWCRMSSFFDWRHNRFGFRPAGTWAGPGPSTAPDGGPVQADAPTEPPGFFPTRPLDWTAARSFELPPGQALSQSPVIQPFDNWIPFQPENPTPVLAPPAEPAMRSLQPLGESPIAIAPYPRAPSGPASAPASAGPPERTPSDASPLGGAAPATRALERPQAQPQNPTVIVIPRRAAPASPSTGPAPRALTPPSGERAPRLDSPDVRPTPPVQRFPSRGRVYPNPEPQGRPLVVVPSRPQQTPPATAPPRPSVAPPSRERSPALGAPRNAQPPQVRRPAERPTRQINRPQQRPAPQVRPIPQQRPIPQVRPQARPTPPRPAAQPAPQRRPQERSGRPPQ